jgi:C4-dicarboxylate-specific signal transduction histidine kinase
MPRPSRHQRPAVEPHVLPLRTAASGTPLTGLLAPVVAEIATERHARGLPPVGVTLDTDAGHVTAAEAAALGDLLRSLLAAACEAAAAAPPRLREVVVTSVACTAGLEIEVADSGPGLAGGPHGSLTAVRPLAERLGGTLAWRRCPEGGSAVTLHLPRRGHQRQAA